VPELTLLHVVGGAHIGYGRMGVYLAKEMREMGVTVYDSIADPPDEVNWTAQKNLSAQMIEMLGERTPGKTNIISWASVPTHARGWWKGQIPIIMTMWEATRLPESFTENLHEFDTVIVPSEHNLELFSGHHPNVKYVPLGVDPERWHYRERRDYSTRFDFLICGSGARKGTDLAVRAFKKAFPEGSWGWGPTPYLVMKQSRAEDWYGSRIERISSRLSGADEADLYGTAHCYVQPSRGEGFGLQPLQAIAQGIPTILTDAHGHASYAHLGMGLNTTLSKAGYFIYGDAQDWWEPDFDELVDSMRYVYDNYDEALVRAKRNSADALSQFTWRHTANGFMDAVGRDRMVEYQGPNEWYKPEMKLYPVLPMNDAVRDIGGMVYSFQKGQLQYAPADVKRIMWESGGLDPTGPTEGLLPEQLARLPYALKRAQYCPHCYQKLNSGTTLADEIMAGEIDPNSLMPINDHAH
jgi:glycosyltransferase involved in cell wall biosynthesis